VKNITGWNSQGVGGLLLRGVSIRVARWTWVASCPCWLGWLWRH